MVSGNVHTVSAVYPVSQYTDAAAESRHTSIPHGHLDSRFLGMVFFFSEPAVDRQGIWDHKLRYIILDFILHSEVCCFSAERPYNPVLSLDIYDFCASDYIKQLLNLQRKSMGILLFVQSYCGNGGVYYRAESASDAS